MAGKKCIGKIKVNIYVLKPTYWLFTSTRSFVAQFLPPQCTPGTQMPSWCTAWQPLLLLNHPKSKGAAIKWPPRGAGVPPIKKPHSKAYLSVMVLYGCGRVAAFYLSPSLGIMRRPDWFKVGILSGIWSVYRRWAAFGANLDLGQKWGSPSKFNAGAIVVSCKVSLMLCNVLIMHCNPSTLQWGVRSGGIASGARVALG